MALTLAEALAKIGFTYIRDQRTAADSRMSIFDNREVFRGRYDAIEAWSALASGELSPALAA